MGLVDVEEWWGEGMGRKEFLGHVGGWVWVDEGGTMGGGLESSTEWRTKTLRGPAMTTHGSLDFIQEIQTHRIKHFQSVSSYLIIILTLSIQSYMLHAGEMVLYN
jgi:hypothetical protein